MTADQCWTRAGSRQCNWHRALSRWNW